MDVSANRYAEPLSPPEPQVIPFKIEDNAGIIFWGLTNATLGIYFTFTLLDRFRRHKVFNFRRCGVLASAALSLTLGCWACQLSCSRVHFVELEEQQLFIGFYPGLIALSVCAPIVFIFGAIAVLDVRYSRSQTQKSGLWNCCACSLLVGLSVGFIHYAPFFSLPSFTARFAPGQVFLVILINVSGSLFSFLAFAFFMDESRMVKKRALIARTFVPFIFGSSVIGSGLLALSGINLESKDAYVGNLGEDDRSQRAMITLALPAIISIALACAVVLLIFSNSPTCGIAYPRLIIASIAIAADGRVLVNEKGMLPTQCVDLESLPEDILEELDIRRPVFHWLLAISFDWSVVSPFLRYITPISTTPDKRPSLWHSLFCCFSLAPLLAFLNANVKSKSGGAVSAPALLKLRLLEAATQLAAQLDLPLEKLGTLHDRALETGTRMGITDFLLLSEHAASQLRHTERSLNASADTNKGLMLFFVRTLSQVPLGVAVNTVHCVIEGAHEGENIGELLDAEYRLQQKYGTRGYKMRFMGRFRDILAETTGAALADVDNVLRGCKDIASRRARSVLEPGCTYVSLFAERVSFDGSSDVLVYDFAKHQLPSYKLHLQTLTPEMRDWLYDMSGFTAADIIQICEDDIEQGRMHLPLSSRSSHGEYEEEHRQVALLHFKKALAVALTQLMRNMSFVGESIEIRTYLTSHVLDVPSVGSSFDEVSAPTHTIVFHTQHLDPSDVDLLEDESDYTHVSSSNAGHNTQQPMPSVFEYTPRALFDVAHALAMSPSSREAFRNEATHELEHLLDAGKNARAQRIGSPLGARRAAPGRLPCALVSSFSIDTHNDEDGGRQSRAAARVRKSWAAVKARARSLKRSSRKDRQVESRSNTLPLSHSASRTQLLSHSLTGSATATTSTASSTIPVPLATLFTHSKSAVEVNSVCPSVTVARGCRDGTGTVGRSWGRSAANATGSGWDVPVRPPPTSFLIPGGHTSIRPASRSVPNFAAATESGFF